MTRVRSLLVAVLMTGLVGGLLVVTSEPVTAATAARAGSPVQKVKAAKAADPVAAPKVAHAASVSKIAPAVFPAAASGEVAVPVSGAMKALSGSIVQVASLRDGASRLRAGTARVEVIDRATAAKTLLSNSALGVKVTPAEAGAKSVDVRVDYSSFAQASAATTAPGSTCTRCRPATTSCRRTRSAGPSS